MVEEIIKDLGDGLILRRATEKDVDSLAAFNSNIHKNPDDEEPNAFIDQLVRDMMSGRHPTIKPTDFTLVIDTKKDKIVSSLNLIPQTWSYDGIEFGVGRPELVGTDPEYRRRGLIREQFKVIHDWSEERGHKLQAITGIPYYYRQFGYEMCLNLGGSRIGYRPNVPELKKDEEERFLFRPAKPDDIPFISKVYQIAAKRSLISCVRTEEIWRKEIFNKSEKTSSAWMIIETQGGERLGVVCHPKEIWSPLFRLWDYQLKPRTSYLEVTPSLLRYLDKIALEYTKEKTEIEYHGYSLELGGEHPAYDALPERMPRINPPYAWYIRLPDLVGFLSLIKPVLEERLALSFAVGYSGLFKLNFYRSGIKMHFEKGKITAVEEYLPDNENDGDVLFPDLKFLQVLVGYRSFKELSDSLPDCGSRNDTGLALVQALFPKKPSDVMPL